MKMRPEEKAHDFCERFDAVIREYEACEDAVPLTKHEIRSAFYQAICPVMPELRIADLNKRHALKE